ncbi:putative serine/threonine protein kinase [Aspergillus pseudonomiae]|nr:putative serine/threonine protein kinase [Aspergillus pseudonomiae]
MSSLFRTGHVLRGKLGKYTIAKRVRDTTVIIKGVENHPRVNNELDILKRFQAKTSCLRPVLDEIEDPPKLTIIVLNHFEDDLLQASKTRPLNRKKLNCVSRRILEALNCLHQGGYIHADLKPDNIFVNYADRGVGNHVRFSDVRLRDLGDTCPIDSKWARSGTPLGAPMWRSPELIMETPWGSPTDIWSYGAVLISLIYGANFNLFNPTTYEEVASPETLHAIRWIMQEIPKSETTPFAMITEKEVCKRDKEFIMEIRKLDWRDRPSARELLEHERLKEGDKE